MSAPADVLVPGARHAVAPAGISSSGWPRIKNTCGNIGWRFDPWQDATGRLILAKRDTGKWAADLSILSIPRQVGKSYLLGCIIFALCLLNPRLRVIWTSHHTATTEEMFEAMKGLADHPRVKPHVVKCIALQGSRWRIVFRNGSRIDFGARERGFGRGKAKVGVLVLDEFQHISSRALANLTPTTNTADNPLILCAGTPPSPNDPGDAFSSRRKAALGGMSDDTLYVEFSAEPDASPDDRKQWAKANPSFPKRTKERAFLLNRKVLDEADFKREMLGIWDEDRFQSAIPVAAWSAIAETARQPPRPVGAVALSVEVDFEREWAAVSVAGERPDGVPQVQVVMHHGGTGWIVDEIAGLTKRHRVCATAIDPNSPAGSLIDGLEAAGVEVTKMTTADAKQACGQFHDGAVEGTFRHLDQSDLNDALKSATRRVVGDGWLWDRKSNGDITSLVSATNALWGWTTRHGSGELQIF